MLVDLLNSANYIMVNMDAIRIFGLNTAVYCAELLNIYKKAVIKKKTVDDDYFKIDRSFITKQASISEEDQLKCDANLIKVNVLERKADDPDVVKFNVETFASILSSEDVKLLKKVSEKVKVENPKGTRVAARERTIARLKEAIRCNTPEVLYAMRDWIDAVMANPNKYLSTAQVTLFKDTLDDYCNGNLKLALELLKIATANAYSDCQWAINCYEKNKGSKVSPSTIIKNETKKTDKLGEEVF